MNRIAGTLLALTILAGVVGCTGKPSTSGAKPTEEPTQDGSRIVHQLATHQVRGDIGPIALDDHRAVFPLASPGEGDTTRVAAFDADTDALSIVAETEFGHGLINWVAVTGPWIGWVDQSRRQSDADPEVLWRIHVLNTETGQGHVIGSNGDRADPFVPQIRAGDGSFFWAEAEPDRTAREYIWQPAWPAARPLLRHVELTPGTETVADGHLVFLGRAAPPRTGHTTGGDCWTVSIGSVGAPEPLTSTGLAMGCAISQRGELVWTEHIDPKSRRLPRDGVLDDPYQVKTQTIPEIEGGSTPASPTRLLHRGYLPWGYPRSGAGFTVWQTPTGRAEIQELSGQQRIRLPATTDALTMATDGGSGLAFVSRAGGTQTLSICDIEFDD